MAEATAKTETVITGVSLELTLDEATTLADITARVGGSPSTTRRAHVQSIAEALHEVNIRAVCELDNYDGVEPADLVGSGNIIFREAPRLDPEKIR